MIYYIADIHFGDRSIFEKCVRPFEGIEEYNKEIINRWNNKVNKEDIVYVLGDITEEKNIEAVSIFGKLNGKKHLIVGNHDETLLDTIKFSGLFETVKHIDLIEDEGRKVCVCHYPLMDWMDFNCNSFLVYGHIHNKTKKNGNEYEEIKKYYSNKPAYNCGVDVTNFEPVTLNEMIQLKEKNKNEAYIN